MSVASSAPSAASMDGSDWHVVPERVAAIIGERRADAGSSSAFSYEGLGKAVGVTGAAISNICRGKTLQPSPRLLLDLAEKLGVPVETMVEGRLPVCVDWLEPDIVQGLRRLEDPQRREDVTRCLRNLLWLGATRDEIQDHDGHG